MDEQNERRKSANRGSVCGVVRWGKYYVSLSLSSFPWLIDAVEGVILGWRVE